MKWGGQEEILKWLCRELDTKAKAIKNKDRDYSLCPLPLCPCDGPEQELYEVVDELNALVAEARQRLKESKVVTE